MALQPVVQHAKSDKGAIVGMWVWRQAPEDTSTGVVPWVYGEKTGRPFTGETSAIMTQEMYVSLRLRRRKSEADADAELWYSFRSDTDHHAFLATTHSLPARRSARSWPHARRVLS